MLLNTPHNPTGKVFTRAELELVCALAREHDAWVVTDEVYEHLVFDGAEHVPVATLPGMARAHPDHLLGRQDLLGHRVEGRLGARARGGGGGRAGGQAVPHLRGVAGRSSRPWPWRSASADDVYAGLASSLQAKRDLLVRGAAGGRAAGVGARAGPTSSSPTPLRWGSTDALAFCRELPGLVRRRRGAGVGVPRRRRRRPARWCASRSASATRCCTRPSPGSPPSPPADAPGRGGPCHGGWTCSESAPGPRGRAARRCRSSRRGSRHPRVRFTRSGASPARAGRRPSTPAAALPHRPQAAPRACPRPTPARERGRHEAAAAARPARPRRSRRPSCCPRALPGSSARGPSAAWGVRRGPRRSARPARRRGPGRAIAAPGDAALLDPAGALSVFAPPRFVPVPAPGPVFLRPPGAGTPRGVPTSSVAAPGRTWTWPLAPRPEVRRRFLPPAHTWSPGHRGVDLAATVGQPVLAAGAGTVSFSGVVAGRGVVTVRHAGGLRTTYEPVDGRAAVGTAVRRGDRVGVLSAASGHCEPAGVSALGCRLG